MFRARASRMLIMIYGSTHATCTHTQYKEVMGGEDPKKQTPVPVMDGLRKWIEEAPHQSHHQGRAYSTVPRIRIQLAYTTYPIWTNTSHYYHQPRAVCAVKIHTCPHGRETLYL